MTRTVIVTSSTLQEFLLVSSPPKLGRLVALQKEAGDTPCGNKDARWLRNGGHLCVTLSNVYALDTERHGKSGPVLLGLWYVRAIQLDASVTRNA